MFSKKEGGRDFLRRWVGRGRCSTFDGASDLYLRRGLCELRVRCIEISDASDGLKGDKNNDQVV